MILNYIEKGCGRPLILLHGNGNSSRYFKKQIRYFSAKFRVIAVDTRGHGKSPRGEGPFTMERFADDLKIFMEEMGIEKADILGFSDGANIALIFALRWPERGVVAVFMVVAPYEKSKHLKDHAFQVLRFHRRGAKIQHIFFHPDCTVGIGVTPIQPKTGSRTLPPVGNCTLP